MSEPSVRRSRPPTIARRRAKVLAGLATQARKPRMGASPLAESEGGETGDQCGRPTQGLQGGGLAIDIPARGFPEVPAAARPGRQITGLPRAAAQRYLSLAQQLRAQTTHLPWGAAAHACLFTRSYIAHLFLAAPEAALRRLGQCRGASFADGARWT